MLYFVDNKKNYITLKNSYLSVVPDLAMCLVLSLAPDLAMYLDPD
nr:hypothetical protein [Mycoplasmopsis bovis]